MRQPRDPEINRRALDSIIRTAELSKAVQLNLSDSMTSISKLTEGIGRSIQQTNNIANIIVRMHEPLLQANQSMIAASRVMASIDVSGILDASKIFSDFIKDLPSAEEIAEMRQIIDKSGFSFASDQLEISFIFSLRAKTSLRQRNSVITRKLLSVANSESFEQALFTTLNENPQSKARLKIMRDAYEAHKNKKYTLSIPALLAQLEGIFTQLLVRERLLGRKNGKLYNTNSKRVIGLRDKGQLADFKDSAPKSAVEHILDELVTNRNDILHGSSTSYPRAKLSTQLLWMIYIFSNALNEGRKNKKA